MERLVSIGEAASALGASITTLRRWEASGRLATEHTASGHRRYDLAKLKPEQIMTIFSARLYGSRSRKNQKLLDGVKAAVEASQC